MNMKSYSEQRTRMMDNLNEGIQDLGAGMQGSPMNQNGDPKIPPAKDVIGKIYPSERDSTMAEKMYTLGEKREWSPELMKHYETRIRGEQDARIDAKTQEILNSPVNNREVRKMKRAAKKEDRAKMKAKRKEGTLDSSDFAQQPYRTLKGKF